MPVASANLSAIPRTSPVASVSRTREFEISDYQGLIQNSSLENELLNAGYAVLGRIVVRDGTGVDHTQYMKAVNKNGQKVFILIDGEGYSSARATDLTLIESDRATLVPYSLKTSAYTCAGKDVCGVAFECGPDSVCVLAREPQDLTPRETNFVYVERSSPAAASVDMDGTLSTYPVIRLSEIRANPELVLANTDVVTRRLRNTEYEYAHADLVATAAAARRVEEALNRFDALIDNTAPKINATLNTLSQWNEIYISNPPQDEVEKAKYRNLQFNLAQRNENISTLLRSMTRVNEYRAQLEDIARSIEEIVNFDAAEFANVEMANSE